MENKICQKIINLQVDSRWDCIVRIWDSFLEFLRIRKVLRIPDLRQLEFEMALSIETITCVLNGIKPKWQFHVHYPYNGIGYRMEYFETQPIFIQKTLVGLLYCDLYQDNHWLPISVEKLSQLIHTKLCKAGKYQVEFMYASAPAYEGKEM